MSKRGEAVLVGHLCDVDSLRVLAEEGLDPEVLPTTAMREVYAWAVDYYHASGCERAPSVAALHGQFGVDLFDDHEIDVTHEPEDSVEWAVDNLKGDWISLQGQRFVREMATSLSESAVDARVEVVEEAANELSQMLMRMARRSQQVELREGIGGRIDAYRARRDSVGAFDGMSLGLAEVDELTCGIHPGELAVLGAYAKQGKTSFVDIVALREWQRGRSVALVTLENSVEMTLDRLACFATNVSATRWMRGECHEVEEKRVRTWLDELDESDHPLWVLQPQPGQRTASHVVRDALLRGADSLVIDQLTFMEVRDTSQPRYLQVREAMHDLKELISTARRRLPCLLAHQVSREGKKLADKIGHLEMHHLAEGSEVERTADWVFGLYSSRDDQAVGRTKLQMLASRRTPVKDWELAWSIDQGDVAVRREVALT